MTCICSKLVLPLVFSPLHSTCCLLLLDLFKSKHLLAHAAWWAIYCASLTGLLLILYCSGSSCHSEVSQCWGLSVWVPRCLLENTRGSERQWIEMWLLSASKCSINTFAFFKPWQSHCCKLTRLSNFPSWNKSFLMYFFFREAERS